MARIYGMSLPELIVGYPTVSDKYNVAGGVLAADSEPITFGRLLKYTADSGIYTLGSTFTAVTELAGVACATNVKLADPWTDEVKVYPGEAVNIMFDGYIALQLAQSLSKTTEIKAGAPVYLKLDTGDLCTNADAGATAVPGWAFTGKYELHENPGMPSSPILVAEVEISSGNFAK